MLALLFLKAIKPREAAFCKLADLFLCRPGRDPCESRVLPIIKSVPSVMFLQDLALLLMRSPLPPTDRVDWACEARSREVGEALPTDRVDWAWEARSREVGEALPTHRVDWACEARSREVGEEPRLLLELARLMELPVDDLRLLPAGRDTRSSVGLAAFGLMGFGDRERLAGCAL